MLGDTYALMIPARPGRVVLIAVCYFLDVMVYFKI